jgi:glutathione S-transferase
MRGEQPDKEVFDKHVAALSLKLDVYEKILSKQKYAAGNVCDLHKLPEHALMGFLFFC